MSSSQSRLHPRREDLIAILLLVSVLTVMALLSFFSGASPKNIRAERATFWQAAIEQSTSREERGRRAYFVELLLENQCGRIEHIGDIPNLSLMGRAEARKLDVRCLDYLGQQAQKLGPLSPETHHTLATLQGLADDRLKQVAMR